MPRGLLAVKLNANRSVTGNLRGFDQFMNIVLDNTVEEVSETERNDMGLVVRAQRCAGTVAISLERGCCRRVKRSLTRRYRSVRCSQVIRGNAIVKMECLERI